MVQADVWLENQTLVRQWASACSPPTGRASSTPSNFPNASTADITQAQNLYAMLTAASPASPPTRASTEAATPTCARKVARGGPDARVSNAFFADTWLATNSLDGQRRFALRAREPVLSTNNSYSTISEAGLYVSRATATCSSRARSPVRNRC